VVRILNGIGAGLSSRLRRGSPLGAGCSWLARSDALQFMQKELHSEVVLGTFLIGQGSHHFPNALHAVELQRISAVLWGSLFGGKPIRPDNMSGVV